MKPDQTAPKEQSDLGPYCLQYMLAKNIYKQMRGADDNSHDSLDGRRNDLFLCEDFSNRVYTSPLYNPQKW